MDHSPNRSWLKAFWLSLGVVFVLFVASGLFLDLSGGPHVLGLLFFVPFTLICCFLGAAAGMYNRLRGWVPGVLLTLVVGSYSGFAVGRGEVWQFLVYSCGLAGTVALTTVLLKTLFGDFRRLQPGVIHQDALRFEIRDLLIWTTVVAVLMALGRFVSSGNSQIRVTDKEVIIILMAAAVAFALVTNIWAIFGNRITAVKVIAVIGVTLAAVAVNYWVLPISSDFFAATTLLNQIGAIGLMMLLRQHGFRFVKARETSTT